LKLKSVECEIERFLWSNRIPNPINLTLTEKQKYNGFQLDDVSSDRNFRHFKNVLNSKVYGNGYRRFGRQLKMLVVREISSLNRHHIHSGIEQPNRLNSEDFVDLIRDVWRSTNFGYEEIHIENPSSQNREDGWLGYILKRRSKLDFSDSIDWNNTTL